MANNYLREQPAIEAGGHTKMLPLDNNLGRNHEQANRLELKNTRPHLGHKPREEGPVLRLDAVVVNWTCSRFNMQQQKILKVALTEREGGSYVD